MKKVDLNVDIGEGFPYDEALLEFATSANICCGRHAGNWKKTRKTVKLCEQKGIRYGMHPGYPSREDMGRGKITALTSTGFRISLATQAKNFRDSFSPKYVKPHGGFYNDTALSLKSLEQQTTLLKQIASEMAPESVYDDRVFTPTARLLTKILNSTPTLLGLPNTAHEVIARQAGATFIREGFADRAYRPDGTLLPRSEPGAVLEDPEEIKAQVLRLADQVDSICLHGDTPNCLEFAEMVYKTLIDHGYEVGY